MYGVNTFDKAKSNRDMTQTIAKYSSSVEDNINNVKLVSHH